MSSSLTTKRLMYVFDDDAPLPTVHRWNLAEGLFLTTIPEYLLSQNNDYHVLSGPLFRSSSRTTFMEQLST